MQLSCRQWSHWRNLIALNVRAVLYVIQGIYALLDCLPKKIYTCIPGLNSEHTHFFQAPLLHCLHSASLYLLLLKGVSDSRFSKKRLEGKRVKEFNAKVWAERVSNPPKLILFCMAREGPLWTSVNEHSSPRLSEITIKGEISLRKEEAWEDIPLSQIKMQMHLHFHPAAVV